MPATPAEFRIGDTWNGLNRAVAPQDLSPSQSPDTTDARNYNRQLGALGQRLGRERILTKSNTILGFGMLVAPFGRFTLTATSDGTWIQEALTWAGVTPAAPTTPSVTGMDGTAGVRFLQYKNRTYAFNGRNYPRCFDGNKVTRMGILGGIDYPQWTPSITLGAALAAPKYLTLAVLLTNVATFTTALAHGFVTGQSVSVNVTSGSSAYNGTWLVASTPTTTTFTVAITHANITSATVAGTVTAAKPFLTSIATVTSNNVTVTTWDGKGSTVAHGFIVGQTVTFINALYPYFSSNSPFTITAVTSTTFTFAYGATIADGTFYDLSATTDGESGMDVYTGTLGTTGITGTFYYMVAPANSTKLEPTGRAVEGLPSALSAVAAPAGQAVTIGGIPTHPDAQVDKWNIYRTLSGQFDTGLVPNQQDFFLLASVTNGTASYVDTIDDATGWYLNATTFNRLRFDQNIPPTFKYAAMYGERMFACGFDPIMSSTVTTASSTTATLAAGTWPDGVKGCYFRQNGDDSVYEIVARPSTTTITLDRTFTGSTGSGKGYSIYRNPWEIWFSEFMSVEAWGPDGEGLRNKLEVPGQQAVIGLFQFEGHLLVFTWTEIYVITGKGPSRFDVQMLPDPAYSGLGAVNGDAIMRCDNEVHFLSLDGPAKVASANGFFSPQLYGIELNTDWLDPLTATELALATCGTDGRSCWYSVPSVVGQVMNSKTFRFERDKQSWWEETGACPLRYIRQDGTGEVIQGLYYIQGKSVMRPMPQPDPNDGIFDLVPPFADSITGSTTASLTDNLGSFPTTNGGLVECIVRIYSAAGLLKDTRRVISNTSTSVTWSTDGTLPYSGPYTNAAGDTYEIGNVAWKWTSKSYDAVDPLRKTRVHLHKAQEVWATYYTEDAVATMQLTDIINGEVCTHFQTSSLVNISKKFDIQKDAFEYAAIVGSRNRAILKNLSIRGIVEAENN